MEDEQHTDPQQHKKQPDGKDENEKNNAIASDGPVSTSNAEGKSDLQENDAEKEETDDISGDLSGNAAGNTEAADQ